MLRRNNLANYHLEACSNLLVKSGPSAQDCIRDAYKSHRGDGFSFVKGLWFQKKVQIWSTQSNKSIGPSKYRGTCYKLLGLIGYAVNLGPDVYFRLPFFCMIKSILPSILFRKSRCSYDMISKLLFVNYRLKRSCYFHLRGLIPES